MTSLYQTPLFMGNPHMWGAEPGWLNELEGIRVPNSIDDLSVIDVEPITGKAIYVNKLLQVNIYVEKFTTIFNWFNPKVKTGLFYP